MARVNPRARTMNSFFMVLLPDPLLVSYVMIFVFFWHMI